MNGTLPVFNRAQKLRDLKQGAIGVGLSISAKFGESRGIEQLLNSLSYVTEAFQDDPDTLFCDPLGVVALLWQRASVAFDNHRQMKLQSLGDTAGPRLSDE